MKSLSWIFLFLLIAGCSAIEPAPFKRSSGHIQAEIGRTDEAIPQLTEQLPILPAPTAPRPLEKYTVTVTEAPVKELLFALARDAKLNIDIAENISGTVTMNAVEKTLPQILERLSMQLALRYTFVGDDLLILPDEPYFKTYTVDYINIERKTSSSNTVQTALDSANSSGEGQGQAAFRGNGSTLDVTGVTTHQLWIGITNNILAILGETPKPDTLQATERVVPVPEAGVITVKATAKQHRLIADFLEKTLANARRQVLIQATIVEVRLTRDYQAGINWELLNDQPGVRINSQNLPDAPRDTTSFFTLSAVNETNPNRALSLGGMIRLLDEFGDVTVISSPQLMALNNQTAILKRVENKVFFTADADTITPSTAPSTSSVDIKINSLVVGIIMSITPYITENGEITLHVRPIISRETGINKNIPLPDDVNLPDDTENTIPETITQEMESIIRVNSGDIAVLGGLMENTNSNNINQVPGTANAGIFSALFKATTKRYQKVELVIFLRPVIINEPSLDKDLQQYRPLLNSALYQQEETDTR